MLGKLIMTVMTEHMWTEPDDDHRYSFPTMLVEAGTIALVVDVSTYNDIEGNCLRLLLPGGSPGWIDESYCREVE